MARTMTASRLAWRVVSPRAAAAAACGPGSQSSTPLVMIHGFGCGMEDWGALPQLLADRSRRNVVIFDNRGVGGSPAPEGRYTIQDLAQDTMSVLDAAELERAHVLGISMGGMIAQRCALDSPARCGSLVLGCTTHGGREAVPGPKEFFDVCQGWKDNDPALQERFVEAFMDFNLPEDFTTATPGGAKLRAEMARRFLETTRTETGLAGQLAALARFNATKELVNIASPTLVIHGDEDKIVPYANGVSLAERIPGARLLTWHGAGHFWWVVRPLEVADRISEFLVAQDP